MNLEDVPHGIAIFENRGASNLHIGPYSKTNLEGEGAQIDRL